MRSFGFFMVLFAALVLFGCSTVDPTVVINSPSGSLTVRFLLKNGVPFYSVSQGKSPIITDSKLGFELKGLAPLNQNFELAASTPGSFDETWTQPWGEVKDIRNHYNSNIVQLVEKSGDKRKLNIEFRVFDDGIGFRYDIPDQPALKEYVIADEQTEFVLAHNAMVWWIPAYRKDNDVEMDSEFQFRKDSANALKEKVHTPLTMQYSDSLFVSIHEAGLIDYAAMTLDPRGLTLKADLVPWTNGDKVVVTVPLKTPWRTIQVAPTAGGLITSYLVLNLNEPNKLGDVSWIKPGKYDGMWWGMHMKDYTWEPGPHHGATTKNVEDLIDFASKHHLSAVLAEGWNPGWEGRWSVDGEFDFTKSYPDYDLAAVNQYAKAKNIALIAHHETGGNISNYERQMEDAFKLLEKYDIHRLKTGYVNKMPGGQYHQGQFMVRHYQKVLETAARYHVMLDVHEPVKDTGLRRTWPNMMTREGARGTEYEAWSVGNAPSHTATLPFTRGLAGPIDYTPGIFNIYFDATKTFRMHSTLAKQLALYVVIYSPFQMAADQPKNYEGKAAFKFIEDVATDWDETRILEGKIGEYVTTVRKDRNSKDWYLGAITDEKGRDANIKLDFLTPGTKYNAEIYKDGVDADWTNNPLPVEITSQEVTSTDVLALKLASGGGAAVRFVAKD